VYRPVKCVPELDAWQLGVLSRWYRLRRQGLLRNLVLDLRGLSLVRITDESIAVGFATIDWNPIEWAEADKLIKEAEHEVWDQTTTTLLVNNLRAQREIGPIQESRAG
jgi:hypothetical protein